MFKARLALWDGQHIPASSGHITRLDLSFNCQYAFAWLPPRTATFFDQEQECAQANAPIYMLTINGNSVQRVPYKIPANNDLEPTSYAMINKSVLALASLNPYKPNVGKDRMAQLAMSARYSKVASSMRRASIRKTEIAAPSSADSFSSDWYILSTTAEPIGLRLPPGAFNGLPLGLNDDGITVGYIVYNSATSSNGFVNIPCFWDRHGNPHLLRLPHGENEGMAWDINSSGTAVGTVYGATNSPSRAALWPTFTSAPTDVNGTLPADSPYDMQIAKSIGDDFSMCAWCQAKPITANSSNYYIGIEPMPTSLISMR